MKTNRCRQCDRVSSANLKKRREEVWKMNKDHALKKLWRVYEESKKLLIEVGNSELGLIDTVKVHKQLNELKKVISDKYLKRLNND